MKHGVRVGILLSLLVATGCSQQEQVRVTYRSNPPGGMLYKLDGELWGECPKVLYYDIDKEHQENGYIEVKGLMVKWPTGPAKRSDDVIRITVDGTHRQVTFVQPEETPESSAVSSGDNRGQ